MSDTKQNDDRPLFVAKTIDEVITTASIVSDDDKVYITGKQLKEVARGLIELQHDLQECHQSCTDMGSCSLMTA